MSSRYKSAALILIPVLVVGSLWALNRFGGQGGDIRGSNGLGNSPPPVETLPAPASIPTTDKQADPLPSDGSMQAPAPGIGKQLNDQNRAAIGLLNEKRYAEAESLFRKCLEADPDESAFAFNLAECLVRRALAEFDAKPKPSFEALLEAITLAPHREDLIGLRDRWSKILDAQKDFAEDQSLHFVLQYDGARDELLSQGYLDVLQDLEAAYQDYGEFFDIFPVEAGRAKFAVVLYDREAFDTVTGIGEWAGGAYDGTIRVPVRNFQRDRARIRETLRHELVHAFIEEVGGKKVPGWLNEGLAQYLSPEHDGARATEVQSALNRMRGKTPLAFETLTGTLAGLSGTETIRMAYDQSLGLTNWIAYHYGERTLVPMITDCKNGKTPAESFQRQLNFALSAATQDFLDSL
ncbi:MAG: hypothetical protein P1V35_02055 [Planctomycetota bacterium]|nr:hypothetical protein [Planctomycetota bacterium]